jgi:hypothetical protein
MPPSQPTFLAILTALAASALLSQSCLAQLPSPRFDRLTPLGAAAGSGVEVEIARADIEDVKTLRFDHPGLRAEFLKDHRFRVTLAKDVPTGTYDVYLVGRFGVSNPRLFAVSRGLTEVAEKEPHWPGWFAIRPGILWRCRCVPFSTSAPRTWPN